MHGGYRCRKVSGIARAALIFFGILQLLFSVLIKRSTYIVFLLFFAIEVNAQINFKGQVPHAKTYDIKQMYDSTYGIQYFDKFCPAMGGDSTRMSPQGYAASGWMEDKYTSGGDIHKGFYANGQLTMYTNFYPNGAPEREYKPVTERKTELKKYFPNGKLKSDVQFLDGNSIIWHDYFDNGQISYIEEYDNKHERLLQRSSYFRDGKPLSIFQPMGDKKPIHYTKMEYYPGGQLKESQVMLYSSDALDFVKDGEDKQFDEHGTLVSDVVYAIGEVDHTIK
jgi:antitoxin component YwqK of YwqJK toxin-antitoxin module